MAKRRHTEEQTTSSTTTLIAMVIGGLLVAGLVVWALTRSVEPAPPAASADSVPTSMTSPISPITNTLPPLSTAAPFSTAAQTETAHDDRAAVPRMAVEDLHAKWKRGDVTIIDVRDNASYAAAHIPGSLHIPLSRIEGEVARLPKNKPIVTYCT